MEAFKAAYPQWCQGHMALYKAIVKAQKRWGVVAVDDEDGGMHVDDLEGAAEWSKKLKMI